MVSPPAKKWQITLPPTGNKVANHQNSGNKNAATVRPTWFSALVKSHYSGKKKWQTRYEKVAN
jgi:hypothetical protein